MNCISQKYNNRKYFHESRIEMSIRNKEIKFKSLEKIILRYEGKIMI